MWVNIDKYLTRKLVKQIVLKHTLPVPIDNSFTTNQCCKLAPAR